MAYGKSLTRTLLEQRALRQGNREYFEDDPEGEAEDSEN